MKFNYDNKYDIMYIQLATDEECITTECKEGLIRKSIKTGKIISIAIFDFAKLGYYYWMKRDYIDIEDEYKI